MSKMPYLTYEECVKNLVKLLREVSNLDKNFIINADSLRGAQPGSVICKKIFEVPDPEKSFIIFELVEDALSSFNGISSISTSSQEILTSYICHIKIYGLNSHNLAYQILAGFKNSLIVTKAKESGLYIHRVGAITSVTEFINNSLWLRCDFDINIICTHQIDFANIIKDSDKEIVSIKNINIITQ